MTQKNYFDGAYLGCDTETGLGFPDWNKLCEAYGLPSMNLDKNWATNPTVLTALDQTGPHCFIVPIDPLQTYWPKITSRITETGTMESNPLHQMSPDLDPEIAQFVYRYL